MEFINTTGNNQLEVESQEMVTASVLISITETLKRGTTLMHIHADGDVKTDLGGWNDNVFTERTIRGIPASGEDIAACLGLELSQNNTLQELLLVRHGLTGTSVVPVATVLAFGNRSLESLHLGQNKLGDAGANIIAKMLVSNCSLKVLHLNRCAIGHEGAAGLAKALKENQSLTELYLGMNRTMDKGARSLADALRRNASLLALGLGSNKIGNDGASEIADAIGYHNRSLMKLELQSNSIGELGMVALADAMLSNTSLTTFTCMDNLEDQERYDQPSSHLSLSPGVSHQRSIFRAPPLARTEHRRSIATQITVNMDRSKMLVKEAKNKNSRNGLRFSWLSVYTLGHRHRVAAGDPCACTVKTSITKLYLDRLRAVPEDAFRLIVQHAVPVPACQRLSTRPVPAGGNAVT